ncbi:uncharacterized protein LOC125657515 isoform X2 [Ostrea edulis]|uniref:uncharacterized protein LOC125657515 isoform X2 n=1 Tax=Ostrea edulis TaxID=37623 RepID=UPI0024AFB6ED|nr:uncharacterized protein LOC125657515 isoform X2 [Ostrea edulis]
MLKCVEWGITEMLQELPTKCWPGTFGENCKDNCPSDHYGKFCKEICQCTPCDKALGCLRQTASSSIDSDDSPPVWDWSITFICLSGGCVLCVGVGLIIFWKSRKRHPRHNGDLEIKGTSANGRSHQTAEESSKCQKKVLFNNFKAKNIDIKLCSSNQGKEGNVYGHHNVALEQYDTLDLKIKANTDYWA